MLADPRRCRILLALDDGRSLTASQLAAEAGVRPATASGHLAKMVAAGLLDVEARGRNRYYRVTGPQIAQVLELISQLAPAVPVHSLRQGIRATALRGARTCYDHLAGNLGVAVMKSLVEAGHLSGTGGKSRPYGTLLRDQPLGPSDAGYVLTRKGVAFLNDFGLKLPPDPVIKYCLDWSERCHHLSGPVGRGLLDRFLDLGWIERSQGSRAVLVTEAGRLGFLKTFGIRGGA